ncbi:MAG: amidohydrolase [Planctomycetota bacterium]|jgi:predicted amidohydrolase YtcJ
MSDALHVRNARIWRGDAAGTVEGAISIERGRLVAPREPAAGERVIDARGRTVAPGLIDAHVHLLMGGATLSRVDLSGVRSRAEFEDRIDEAHRALPEGRWLIANGWTEEDWPDHRPPDKSWLRAAGDRPVVCHRMDLHASLVNDAVLRRCDTDREPEDGRIERDPDTGEPTGLMVEAAAWHLVNPLIPVPDAAERRAALRAAQSHCHRFGITTVGAMEYWSDLEEVFAPMREELTLRCRITLLDRTWPLDPAPGAAFAGDERLAVIGYKAFVDGTLGSRSARMLEPYADAPDQRGLLVELAAEGHLDAWAARVAAAGLSPSIHAIGDEAVRLALSAVRPLPAGCRPRIEHAQHLDLADIPRFAGLIASMQPRHMAEDGRYVERRLGSRRVRGSFAFRSLHAAGARLAFGSDWPVVSCDPVLGLAAAVTGRTVDGTVFQSGERLAVEDALTAYTAGAAHALGLDDAGVLRPGALGDLVMFDRDPLTADWRAAPPRVVLTVAGGAVVHEADVVATAAGGNG